MAVIMPQEVSDSIFTETHVAGTCPFKLSRSSPKPVTCWDSPLLNGVSPSDISTAVGSEIGDHDFDLEGDFESEEFIFLSPTSASWHEVSGRFFQVLKDADVEENADTNRVIASQERWSQVGQRLADIFRKAADDDEEEVVSTTMKRTPSFTGPAAWLQVGQRLSGIFREAANEEETNSACALREPARSGAARWCQVGQRLSGIFRQAAEEDNSSPTQNCCLAFLEHYDVFGAETGAWSSVR